MKNKRQNKNSPIHLNQFLAIYNIPPALQNLQFCSIILSPPANIIVTRPIANRTYKSATQQTMPVALLLGT